MGLRDRGAKRPWSRERWFLLLLTPIYVAMVAYCLNQGGLALGQSRDGEEASRVARLEFVLPTSDPARITPAPTQTPPGTHRKLDINQADAWMLTAIPGIGEALAGRIVAYRDAQGKLFALEELTRVEGVGERLYATLAEYLEVR